MPRLTPTSFAILGLLAIRPWSTYELTKLLGRSVQYVMPRTEANRYQEPKRLVEAGLATAADEERRPATTDRLLDHAGRSRCPRRLARAPGTTDAARVGGPAQGALREHGPAAHAARADRGVRRRGRGRRGARGGRSPGSTRTAKARFPERIHINALFWVLLDRWARLRAEWARWAAMEVESWPDEQGPIDRDAVQALLDDMLAGRWGLGFPDRPSSRAPDPDTR